MKVLKAAICAFVHNKGWCNSMHREVSLGEQYNSGCPFKDAALFALFPPIILGNMNGLWEEKATEALSKPGSVIIGV